MTNAQQYIRLSQLLKDVRPEHHEGVYKAFYRSIRDGKLLAVTLTETFTIGSTEHQDELLSNDQATRDWLENAVLQERMEKLSRNSEAKIQFTPGEAEKHFMTLARKRQANPNAAKPAASRPSPAAKSPAAKRAEQSQKNAQGTDQGKQAGGQTQGAASDKQLALTE